MKCTICHKNESFTHPDYGNIPCVSCQQAENRLKSPKRSVEFTTENIKWERKEYHEDIVQPTRNGEIAKEFVDIHGKEKVMEVLNVTEQEVDNAKYVWTQHGDTEGSYYTKNI